MPKYQIFTKFEIDGWIEVEADTVAQAVEVAKNSASFNLLHQEEKVTVDLQNSYEWIGEHINDWTELDVPEEMQEQETRYANIIIQGKDVPKMDGTV